MVQEIDRKTVESWGRRNLRPAVWVNLSANNGRARDLWIRIEPDITRLLPDGTAVRLYESPHDLTSSLQEALDEGVNCLISAGGDGSVNALLNTLISVKGENLSAYAIGGIGLGSSNDFVKPATLKAGICATRLDADGAGEADIGSVTFLGEDRALHKRCFLLNASLGVTAEANWLFNRGDAAVDRLKSKWVHGAIWYAAVKSIIGHSPIEADLVIDGHSTSVTLSNLAVLVSPFVSGKLCYPRSSLGTEGRLGVNYCHDMNRSELLRTLLDLRRGRFSGVPKRVSRQAGELSISTRMPVTLEMDGEVVRTTKCTFSLLTSGIRLLGV